MRADDPRVLLPSGLSVVGTPEEIVVELLGRAWLADARRPDETERRIMLAGPLAVMLERYDESQLRTLIAAYGVSTAARDARLMAAIGATPPPIDGLPKALRGRGLHQRVHQHMLTRSNADDVAAISIISATTPAHVGDSIALLMFERARLEGHLGRG